MILYNEKGEKIEHNTDIIIGRGSFGSVYKLSDDECLKTLFTRFSSVDKNILITIKNLSLDHFYQIYELLYNEKGFLKAYRMKYYQKEEIDLLICLQSI